MSISLLAPTPTPAAAAAPQLPWPRTNACAWHQPWLSLLPVLRAKGYTLDLQPCPYMGVSMLDISRMKSPFVAFGRSLAGQQRKAFRVVSEQTHELAVLERLRGAKGVVMVEDVLDVGSGVRLVVMPYETPACEVECERCEVRRMIRDVLQAMEHVHSRGVLHRDLTLRNVLRTPTGFVLCDFGDSILLPPSPSPSAFAADYRTLAGSLQCFFGKGEVARLFEGGELEEVRGILWRIERGENGAGRELRDLAERSCEA